MMRKRTVFGLSILGCFLVAIFLAHLVFKQPIDSEPQPLTTKPKVFEPGLHPSVSEKSSLPNKPEESVGEQPPSEKEICREIDALISSRNFAAALAATNRWLEQDIPLSVRERLLQYKGNLLFAMGDLQQAYDIYRQVLLDGERDDVRGWATVKLYVVARKLGKTDGISRISHSTSAASSQKNFRRKKTSRNWNAG